MTIKSFAQGLRGLSLMPLPSPKVVLGCLSASASHVDSVLVAIFYIYIHGADYVYFLHVQYHMLLH